MRQACRLRHFSHRTEAAYCHWIRQFIVFHGSRHPSALGATDLERFLSSLATDRHVSASTQNQALCAVLFLYRAGLHVDLPAIVPTIRVHTPPRLPTVLNRSEVRSVLAHPTGVPWLTASLLYGAGLRLLECLELRVKDLDFERRQITVRQGKGRKDHMTMPMRSTRSIRMPLGRGLGSSCSLPRGSAGIRNGATRPVSIFTNRSSSAP